jgi:AraC family transcriptional regulator
LLGGGDSIKAVGSAIGFATTSSFALAFRRATALTPNQFRQRILRSGG